jgi:predicted outer membrane repeat protein
VASSAITTKDSPGGAELTFAAAATFRGNGGPAVGQAGALYLTGVRVTFGGTATFDSNTAATDGGGVWCGAGTTLTFAGPATFSGNAAGRHGGGVFVTSSCTTFFGSNGDATAFTGNKAAT